MIGEVLAAAPSGTADVDITRSSGGETAPEEMLLDAVNRCVDTLLHCAVVDPAGAPTWASWIVGEDGLALGVGGGRHSLYDGDAGVVWSLSRLGDAMGRRDAADMALRGKEMLASTLLTHDDEGEQTRDDGGLLCGAAGIDLVCQGSTGLGWSQGSDLTDGLAGILLQLARLPTEADTGPNGGSDIERHARRIVAELRARSRGEAWGRSWPDERGVGDAARPLCGLAHGASGIAWGLTEAAARWPVLRADALALADAALAWESSWTHPLHGSWPDLRDGEVTWPNLWCHGSTGAGAVRLRLIELAQAGLPMPWPIDWVNAEAEGAIQRCGLALEEAMNQVAEQGPESIAGGWTLCHGLAGLASVLALATKVWDEPVHRTSAVAAAAFYVCTLPDDPGDWPSGLRGADGDLGLMTGIAGTALQLAELARPGVIPSVALLAL